MVLMDINNTNDVSFTAFSYYVIYKKDLSLFTFACDTECGSKHVARKFFIVPIPTLDSSKRYIRHIGTLQII